MAIQQILSMDSQTLQQAISQKLSEAPQSLFGQRRPIGQRDNVLRQNQFEPEKFRNFAATKPDFQDPSILPVDIFSRPGSNLHLTPQSSPSLPQLHRPAPQSPPQLPPPQFPEAAFAAPNPGIEQELESFRAEADKANESAIKKQIEALKQIIAQQNSQ